MFQYLFFILKFEDLFVYSHIYGQNWKTIFQIWHDGIGKNGPSADNRI